MGGGADAIGVRTKHDREEEEHDRRLQEKISAANQNPFQSLADPVLAAAAHVYNTYLYSSGVMFLALAFWSAYPSVVRFRHLHVFRYRRTQLSFRRGLFATEHMPKWNKRYLQRVVVPPHPASVPAMEERGAAPSVPPPLSSALASTTTAVSVAPPAEAAVTVPGQRVEDTLFTTGELTASRTAHGSFGAGATEKSERALSRELQRINRDFFGPKERLFDRPIRDAAALDDLQTQLEAAVAAAGAVVVLKETHDSVRSIPAGWEVWWISEPEARRRRFCRFWLGGLLCGRAFQDLMEMPEMPDLIN
ncbi:hypothetical protein NESM_000006200 [Novymonas esmeraldas]|uniref:Uncharacterized protein n=1 Tax=Novymonas esmeraldas TaxID=1808958 RepID=A0AAW0F1Y7_9TRYP